MRKRFPTTIVRLLLALALLGSLVAITAVPVSAQTATLVPGQGPVGTSVTVTATGFAGDSILTATFDGGAVTTAPTVVKTAANGTAVFALLVPTATAGAHAVRVSDGVNTNIQPFTVEPRVVVSSPATKTGPVGASATVTGTGFAAGFTVNVTVGPQGFASVVSDNAGGFTAIGTIPLLPSGNQTVTAADLAGNNANANPDTFTVTPSLAVTPTSGLAGSSVTVTGTGWGANDTITLTFAGAGWTTVTATPNGAVNTPGVATPATALPGVTQITGTDTSANTASTTFIVDPRPLTVSPSSGPMGTTVLLQASNMSPNGNIAAGDLTIALNAWNIGTTINIGTAGEMFPTSLVVPTGLTVGANTVRATDNNGLVAAGTYNVTRPTLAVNPASGPRGSSVTLTGTGWVPNATVSLAITNTTTVMTVIADANGDIAAALNVPADAATGANTITAGDTLGNAAAPATFTVPGAAISVDPNEGGPGTAVTVSGTGFAGYTAITITFGGYQLPSQPLSSALGDFTYTATVPGIAPGSQVVQANDGTSTATTFFVVTAAPETVQTALAGISDCLVRVWGYYAGEWQMYDPADPIGSDLTSLTAGRGYWIKVDADCELIFGGNSWDLTTGWNLIGWR